MRKYDMTRVFETFTRGMKLWNSNLKSLLLISCGPKFGRASQKVIMLKINIDVMLCIFERDLKTTLRSALASRAEQQPIFNS